MLRSRSTLFAILFVAATLTTAANRAVAPVATASEALPSSGRPQVTLAAGQATVSWDARIPDGEPFELPLLTLHREQKAAPESGRSITVHLSGLAGGRAIQLEAVSRHENVLTGEPYRATMRAQLPDRPCTADAPCAVEWTLEAGTLSDLYTLRVLDETGALLWENEHADRPDFAALDTWEAGVDGHRVRVTYAALYPFVRGPDGLDKRLSPAAVHDFVGQFFVPTIVETWRTQFDTWSFGPIHAEWDADKVVEITVTTPPFALNGGTGIYTASHTPERRLWWFSSSPAYDRYDSLENGYRAVLSHEFYHMVQWNSLLAAGCSTEMWHNLFIEAQAKMVPSVQYPELELLGGHVTGAGSAYQSAARHFTAHSLNAAYAGLEADRSDRYDWAPYWRFLYEQTGGLDVLRASLEEMACRYDPDVEAGLPAVMDAALARADGPFGNFEESLVAFAEANYALRLENGRCGGENPFECENVYYDPSQTYKAPMPEAELPYRGAPLAHSGAIPAAFGMDFVEIKLDEALAGQPLRIAVEGEGRFSVRLWRLGGGSAQSQGLALAANTARGSEQLRALDRHPAAIEPDEEGTYTAWLPSLDPIRNNRLVLIVVRLDAGREVGATGNYTIALNATPRAGE